MSTRFVMILCMAAALGINSSMADGVVDVHSHIVTGEISPNVAATGTPVVKESMQADGFVRLSKIEVDPQWLDEYMQFAMEVGSVSLQTEPGVLTMYAMADKDNPCNVTILETYSSQEAYRKHIASPHFQKYKQGTLHMVKSLVLDDVTPLNPNNQITNFIIDK